ncbi:hypothetical protein [Streptomyces sp. NPDC086182]
MTAQGRALLESAATTLGHEIEHRSASLSPTARDQVSDSLAALLAPHR